MSNRRPAPKNEQPDSFSFNDENLKLANKHIAKYPEGRQASSVMPLLDIAQRQHNNWIPMKAIEYIAKMLAMPVMHVLEVATFYTMYNLAPVGKYHIQLCGTTPCWLRGSDKIKETCKNKLNLELGEISKDGLFSLIEVECLGACANAPMIQINDDFYEDLNPELMEKLLDNLKHGREVIKGSQIGRKSSENLS